LFVTNTEPPKIQVALGKDTNGEKFAIKDFSSFIIKSSEMEGCLDPTPGDVISSPHSNSFIDLNGDCMPDIFLQKQRVMTNL